MPGAYIHLPATHPPLRSTVAPTRCVCNGLQSEHRNASGACAHCGGQCVSYRPTANPSLPWHPSYE